MVVFKPVFGEAIDAEWDFPKDGQTTSVMPGDLADDGRGHAVRDFDVLTTGQYSGTTNLALPLDLGNVEAHSNNCVLQTYENGKQLMWSRYQSGANIGFANDGKLYWGFEYTGEVVFSNALSKMTITPPAQNIYMNRLIANGASINISGSNSNDGDVVAGAIGISYYDIPITVAPTDETVTCTLTLVHTVLEYIKACNAGSGLAGYTDWMMPKSTELVLLISPENSAAYPSEFPSLGRLWSSSTSLVTNVVWAGNCNNVEMNTGTFRNDTKDATTLSSLVCRTVT